MTMEAVSSSQTSVGAAARKNFILTRSRVLILLPALQNSTQFALEWIMANKEENCDPQRIRIYDFIPICLYDLINHKI